MDINVSEIISILAATLCGAVIGLEREVSRKPAGLRTNVLICIGAAVFTIFSNHFAENADSASRITAQIISGIGFLGAGAIIRESGAVQGLTTAATIWLIASIGMACGAGFYMLASIATVLTLIVLFILGILEKQIRKRRKLSKSEDQEEY